MCGACEIYEINLIRQRVAARIRRERMIARAIETEGETLPAQPEKRADETPTTGVIA